MSSRSLTASDPIDPKWLQAFLVVADELHFGRAAGILGIAQSTLSDQIAQLERRIGLSMFDRDTRNVRLTTAGTAAIEPARRALRDLDEFVRVVTRSAGGTDHLDIAMGPRLAILAPMLKRIEATATPLFSFNPQVAEVDEGLRRLRRSEFDAVLAIVMQPGALGECDWIAVCCEQTGVVMSPVHPLATHERLSPAAAAAYPVVAPSSFAMPALRGQLESVFETATTRPTFEWSGGTLQSAMSLHDAHHVEVSTRILFHGFAERAGLVFRPFDPVISGYLGFVVRSDAPADMRERLGRVAKALAGELGSAAWMARSLVRA